MTTTLKIKLLSEYAVMPVRANPGDSGLDLFIASSEKDPLWAGETRTVWTDIAIELPPHELEAQVRPRSSWSKRGVFVQLGTIDSTFRGNIGITVYNSTREMVPIPRGTKIAQLVICPVKLAVELEAVEELGVTARGDRGFGSTGP